MRIGELVKQTGVTKDAIRLYEKLGMLKDVTRPYEWNNYKDYGEANVMIIRCIKEIQKFRFTLREIKEILDMRAKSSNVNTFKREIFNSKLKKIDQEIETLQEARKKLVKMFS